MIAHHLQECCALVPESTDPPISSLDYVVLPWYKGNWMPRSTHWQCGRYRPRKTIWEVFISYPGELNLVQLCFGNAVSKSEIYIFEPL
jgi:hypothetical protein